MSNQHILKWFLTLPFFYIACSFGHAESLVVDLARTVPAVEQVKEGLFPNEACEELRTNGFKCMGFKPAVRFSISNSYFELGSAELPIDLKKQLDVFAQVLSNRQSGFPLILVTGHTDVSGNEPLNKALSSQRASAVKSYLVHKGVSSALLISEGKSSRHLADLNNPFSATNRRVEISRLP